jgi:hypothetical protein
MVVNRRAYPDQLVVGDTIRTPLHPRTAVVRGLVVGDESVGVLVGPGQWFRFRPLDTVEVLG